ncbi:MAG: AsmA-like C-terminal region-containing protein [Bacteroidia bacterium]|nr:AsmA-like C-terminal region-containing protein [Bacteroidia bacterium]
MKRKKIRWVFFFAFLIPISLLGFTLVYVYQNQQTIVQAEIDALNQGFQGKISIGETHLAPFENFPYISIKVDSVKVFESKKENAYSILEVADIYVGLDISDIIQGKIDIKKLLIEDGFFDIVLHEDGTNNLSNALASQGEEEESEPLHIHLQNIELRNLDVHKINESSGLDVEAYIYWAEGSFKSTEGHIAANIDTGFDLNIMVDGDTTFIKHKHIEFHTDVDFDERTGQLSIAPSDIVTEYADFDLTGTVNTKNKMDLDLEIKGTKPNFDLFIAFAPAEIIPILERYKNAGKIYFNSTIQGPAAFGYSPFVNIDFGASEAFLENTRFGRRVEEMGFEGHFSNGGKRDLSTMQFSMSNMTANLEKGKFIGNVEVKNFEEPDIKMEVDAQFELDFIAEFLNLNEYEDAEGTVDLKMNFHDIIDLDNPEEVLNNLDQAYYSELTLKNLSINAAQLPAPLKNLNAHMIIKGKRAELDQFEVKFGESDLSMRGYLTDLPAIIHHSDVPVFTHLEIKSDVLDIAEISSFSAEDSTGIDERIEDLRLGLSFQASARDFTEAKHLPSGEFFVDSLHAQLKHYPHELHDFHVDLLIDEHDIRIKDFTGYIDKSDFHVDGEIHEYAFWMKDTLNGDVDLDIGITSRLLRLEDIFSYQGENYVPEDYRHEEFDNLALHFSSSMHYKDSELQSIDIDLDKFDAKMHLHPMRFKDFNGRIHYEDEHLLLENFHAQMGRSIFNVNMDYFLGADSTIKKRDNYLSLKTNYIDFDQLSNYNLAPPQKNKAVAVEQKTVQTDTADVAEHAEAFNLYELPFTDMRFDVDIGHFIYHRLDLQNINADLRITQDHYVYVDTLSLNAAGGEFHMKGYFNGSDPKHIYLKPDIDVQHVDLDKLLFKFENFGQDVIVSENLHGELSAKITGNIRVYPDFVPDLDQSEVHMDVVAVNGRLENYDYMLMLSDYFGDKDLSNVRFDTLRNHLDVTNGVLSIPNMTIESTLGHMDISGSQDMNDNIEYYMRIPWKLIKQGARNRIFGSKKNKEDSTTEDEIIEVDPNKKVRYLNVKIMGTLDDFDVKMGKKKE